ncbi:MULTISPECIES: hypothetical protein [unclassified Bradyrhizobium]
MRRFVRKKTRGLTVLTMMIILAPELIHHLPGSWGARASASPASTGNPTWDKTEQAIFTSFFIGVSRAVAAVAAIKVIEK